jgi:hypothetical protein
LGEKMTRRLLIGVAICFASVRLLAASEPSVSFPTNDWHYVYCGVSGGDVILQLEYSVEGVAQQDHQSVHFRKEVLRPPTASGQRVGPILSRAAGAPKGAPISGLSTTVAPGSSKAKGVPVSLSFRWTDRGTPHTLEQLVFVSYEGITSITNGQFTMKAYFEPNKSVEPTRAPEGARGSP